MTSAEFRSWREDLGLSQQAAARALGISKSSIELYERGNRRDDGRAVLIPTTVALACKYLSQRVRLQQQLQKLESGKLTMRGELRGVMVDTTTDWIAELRTWISDLEAALAEARKWH